MISIICVYNNEGILKENLLDTLSRQSAEYELVRLDNRSGDFKSAASALNKGASQAKEMYLMFVHQDVALGSPDFLKDAERMMEALPKAGIAGVAGRLDRSGVLTNMTHGTPPTPAGHMRIDKPEKVQTVDECLFIVPRAVFDKLQFDERACFDWHLYAVDYSLSALKLGYEVYVLPLEAHHQSGGASMSKMYHRTLSRVAAKHRGRFPWIHTSLGSWRTRIPVSLQLFSIRLKRKLRGGP